MPILNIAGYKFVELTHLDPLREELTSLCSTYQLSGTILLSLEGINITLAGLVADIAAFKAYLITQPHFYDMTFRESHSTKIPFKRLKVKIKKEIITFRQDSIHPELKRAPAISPLELKQWLDEKRDITLFDTRNDYEVRFGTFEDATDLGIDDFSDLAKQCSAIPRDKPIVMFCTGGVRCEKAGLYLLDEGYTNVYQLEGGILNYFAEAGGSHYKGDCFVFDERIALNPKLKETGTKQCLSCHGPATVSYKSNHSDTFCQTCDTSPTITRNL